MTWQTWVYLALIVAQLVGTTTFITVYSRSDWRSSAVGRHLMFYTAASGGIDLSWALLILAKWPWLMYVLFAAQAVFASLIWQRVRLVRNAQHESEDQEPP